MPQPKSDKPSIATFADHEVITPPNPLRAAISITNDPGGADDAVARAEAALAQLSNEFATWMVEECERLSAARGNAKANGFNKARREALFHSAHDIKGEAATFGFPWIAALADSLCRLLDHTPDINRVPLVLIDQHVDAIRAVVRESGRPDVAVLADALNKKLREVTDDFLSQANRDRPGYLDGIVAPSVVPGE